MLDNTWLKKKKTQRGALSIHENTFGVNGFSFPNTAKVVAVKKETEFSDFK